MSLPLLDYELMHDFPDNDSVLPLEAFRFDGADYCGAQPSAWESSEASWDNGDPAYPAQRDVSRGYGRWMGPGAVHARAGELWLENTVVTAERAGHDDLARVAVNSAPRLVWVFDNPALMGLDSATWRVLLQDAATGEILQDAAIAFALRYAALPPLAGHAIAWVRLENARRAPQMPPDYAQVTGNNSLPNRYRYVKADGSIGVWDYIYDVGERPANHQQTALDGTVLWAAYWSAFESGALQHRGAWTQYVVDEGQAEGGPWSALRIAVGDQPFTVGAAFQPAPGAVMQKLLGDGSRQPFGVDALALSVSCWTRLRHPDRPHDAEIAGTIATRSGPATALWAFHPGDANGDTELLGITQRNYVPVCEASLYPTVTDLLELADGARLVLSMSHLYEYMPEEPDLTERLPGLPRGTKGHPGGRCLRSVDNGIRFFTEYFGGVGAPQSGDAFAQFYNTLRTLDPAQRATSGKGTVFHGNNCAEVCWGKFYGWAQDKAFGDPDARQYLAFLQDGAWITAGMAPFPAASHRWQRVRALGTARGLCLIASGKRAGASFESSEAAVWGVADGQEFREATLPFRPRRLTRVVDENDREWLYCVGRFVEEDEDGQPAVATRWSVIRLSGQFVTVTAIWDPDAGDSGGFCLDRAQAEAMGLNPALLPPYLRWIADVSQPAGGYWMPSAAPPDEPYLELSVGETSICYLLHGVLPYDPLLWPGIIFPIYDDGSVGPGPFYPEPGCAHAQCVLDTIVEHPLPEWGSDIRYLIISQEMAGGAWTALQVSDVNEIDPATRLRKLCAQTAAMPNLWARIDSNAPLDDLTTYDILVPWNQFFSLPREAAQRMDICVLSAAALGRIVAPVLERRN